jgi:hypothetical protein
MTVLAIAAILFLFVAAWKHITLEQVTKELASVKADIAKADAKVSAVVARGVQATKEDVKAAIADIKKWV